MSERDLIIERLERKLAEKEKELRELRRVANMNIEELKEEIIREISSELGRIKMLEAKVAELNKTVESLMNEVLYLKTEISKGGSKSSEIKEIGDLERDFDNDENRSDEIIVCD